MGKGQLSALLRLLPDQRRRGSERGWGQTRFISMVNQFLETRDKRPSEFAFRLCGTEEEHHTHHAIVKVITVGPSLLQEEPEQAEDQT
jgi:hypothetical protein